MVNSYKNQYIINIKFKKQKEMDIIKAFHKLYKYKQINFQLKNNILSYKIK